jgi:hypothetical protein
MCPRPLGLNPSKKKKRKQGRRRDGGREGGRKKGGSIYCPFQEFS